MDRKEAKKTYILEKEEGERMSMLGILIIGNEKGEVKLVRHW